MFSRTHKVDTFSSRWSPRVGGHNGHHNEILQGAMFASFSVLDYHIRSGTSSVCQLLPPIRFVHPRSLSLSLPSPFNFLRCVPSSSSRTIPSSCVPSPLLPSSPNRSFSSLPSSPALSKPRTRHVFILSRSVRRRLFHRLPSGIMHVKRRRLKDRRLRVPCSEFFDIN